MRIGIDVYPRQRTVNGKSIQKGLEVALLIKQTKVPFHAMRIIFIDAPPIGIIGNKPIILPSLFGRQTDKIAQPLAHTGSIGGIGGWIETSIGPSRFAQYNGTSANMGVQELNAVLHVRGGLINVGGAFPKGKLIKMYHAIECDQLWKLNEIVNL